ncbi:MAG: hypothetical protein ACTSRP_00755 [Candidatus Helarchaeota archaeon]
MNELYKKMLEFCNKFQNKECEFVSLDVSQVSDYFPEGLKMNLIVSDRKNFTFTIFISKKICKIMKGQSSSQLNLTAKYDTWLNVFNGKDRILRGVMEGRIKLRGIRPTFSQLILFSSLIYYYSNYNSIHH